jgi:hypothetical protein
MQIVKAGFDFNGTVIDDIQQVKEHEKEFGKEVEFVGKTGYAPVVGKNGFSIKYAPPQSGKFDFTVAQYDDDVTFTVYYDGGTSKTYHKVHLLKCSENEGGDGKTEFAYTYDFTAGSVSED